jgi:DNA-binding CsgD family transcriptional regulator
MLDLTMARRGRPPHPDVLTPREWEVLALLREGCSNEEVARRLGISVAGAKYHVSEILSKLGVSSREEAARWSGSAGRPWWAAAVAPAAGLRGLGIRWLSPALAGALAVLVAAGVGLLVWGVVAMGGGGSGSATPDIVDGPLPERVAFAAGETISADGPGIFFLDPLSGLTEGWVAAEGSPFVFRISAISADGRLLLYACEQDGLLSRSKPVPCGASEPPVTTVWYLFDTTNGGRMRLPLAAQYHSLSPDGATLLVETEDGIGLASVDAPEMVRIVLPAETAPPLVSWSLDGMALVLATESGTSFVSTDGEPTELLPPHELAGDWDGADWAPDGSEVALAWVRRDTGTAPGVAVYSDEGRVLWSEALGGLTTNLRWSPDGSRLAVETEGTAGTHLVVFDGTTGAPQYRISGGTTCGNPIWTADGSGLVFTSWAADGNAGDDPYYGLRSVLADPSAGTFSPMPPFTVPTPFDASLGVRPGFEGVNLTEGFAAPLADTAFDLRWASREHRTLFADERIVFQGGDYGGHGEGCPYPRPDTPVELTFDYAPFEG